MTPQDHNKVLGIMHLVYGGFFALMTLLMLVLTLFMVPVLRIVPPEPNAPPMGFILAIMGFVVVLYGFLSLPSLVAGYGMLKRRSWARIAGIVASVLSALSFPFGTALCVYSLWFFFGDQGKAFERSVAAGEEARGALGGARSSAYDWNTQRAGERTAEYAPPPEPPSWR